MHSFCVRLLVQQSLFSATTLLAEKSGRWRALTVPRSHTVTSVLLRSSRPFHGGVVWDEELTHKCSLI